MYGNIRLHLLVENKVFAPFVLFSFEKFNLLKPTRFRLRTVHIHPVL